MLNKRNLGSLISIMLLVCNKSYAQSQMFECIIDPAKIVKIASPVQGILAQVVVGRGDNISKGQVIAKLESSVEATTAELLRIQANDTSLIEVEKEQLALSKISFERADKLEQGTISEQMLDERQSEYAIQNKELEKAELDHKVLQMELKRAEEVLERRTIRSPYDGVITEKILSAGEFVGESTHIVTLAKLDPLHVETFVPTELYETIKEGQTATVMLAPPFNTEIEATVIIVDQVFDAASGTFGVRLEIANKENAFPGGMRCQLEFN